MKLSRPQRLALEVAPVHTVYRLKQNDGEQKGIWSIAQNPESPATNVNHINPKPPLKLIEWGLVELTDGIHDDPYAKMFGGVRQYRTEVLSLTDKGEAFLAGVLLE